jgi:prepilin-type N-terminal cleavage/methylation domain-containing protein
MISKSINSKTKARGFTIVELLVVIVVIGILAGITVVSYTGITAQANTAKNQTNANSVKSVAEVFFATYNKYPRTADDFRVAGLPAVLPSNITILTTTALDSSNGAASIKYMYCGDVADPGVDDVIKGGRIQFWDFSTGAASANVIYVGTGSATTGAAPCHTYQDAE